MNKKIIITMMLIFGVGLSLHAQKVMSLKDCMQYAISNSTKIRIQRAAIGDAQIDRRNAILAAFTPYIEGNAYAYYNFGRSIDPESNIYNTITSFHNSYSLGAGINLFNGFEAVNNLKISKTSLEMSGDAMAQAEADICLATMEAYYNYVYYSRLADIYTAQIETAKNSLTLAEKQEKLGTKGYADVVQMRAELADREYEQTNAANLRNDAFLTLKDVMFWPVDSVLVVDTELPEYEALLENYDEETILNYIRDNNPEVKIARGTMENAKLDFNTSKMKLAPKISLYAGWNTNYYEYPNGEYSTPNFKDQFQNNRGEYVELALNIPIYNRLQKQGNISKKKNAYEKASAEYDAKLREIESEVRRAIQDRDGAVAAYIQAQRKSEVQEEAYGLNRKKFDQGLISSIEYQTATNNYLTAQADYMNAMFKYLIKRSIVRYYSGENYINQ